MVTILQKCNSDSPKLAALKRRPELPHSLVAGVILRDKIDHDHHKQQTTTAATTHEQVPSINSNHSIVSKPPIGKEVSILKSDLLRKELLIPLKIGKKITLKSFELNSGRPRQRLFRHETISGAFPLKVQEMNKEIKTCKVQPICVPRHQEGPTNVSILEKSFSIGDTEAERDSSEIQSFPLKRVKLLRSESDAGARLKYFSLRRPRINEEPKDLEWRMWKRWNSQLGELQSFLADGDDDDGEIRASSKVIPTFNENCRSFLSQREHSRPTKSTSLLLRQNSLDLLNPDDWLDDCNSNRSIENEKSFNGSQNANLLTCSSIVQLTKNIFNNKQPASCQSSFQALPDDHPETSNSNRTSHKSSTTSKVSKKTKVTSSFVRNVPSLLSGLRKSLPLQTSSSTNELLTPSTITTITTSPPQTTTADKEMAKKLRLSPARMFPGKNRSTRPIKSPMHDEHRSTQTPPPAAATPSSSPSKSTGNGVHQECDSTPKMKHQKHPGRPSITPSLETCLSNVSQFSTFSEDVDKRDFILKEFLISEKQYVETLRMLVEKYMLPLKTQDVVDSAFVEEIFYKVQEIYVHHATLMTFLAKALSHWNQGSTVGDVIFKHFSKETVVESYASFIEHFPRAEKALQEVLTKSSFQKFIEQCEKETKMKLPLMAQLVKPVQRIPRYELLLKRLLENTPLTHPDYPLLKQAEEVIHDLAIKINELKNDDSSDESQLATIKKLELLLFTDLVTPGRFYVRNDMVSVRDMKDQTCCLWFFSDLLVFSVVKRKNSGSNRKTTLLLRSAHGNDYVENVKHKVWFKCQLNQVQIIHSTLTEDLNEKTTAKVELEKDHKTLNEIVDLTNRLKCSHFSMDEAVETVAMEIGRKLKEINNTCLSPEKMHHLLLQTNAQDCPQQVQVTFSTAEKQMHWEMTFLCYQKKSDTT